MNVFKKTPVIKFITFFTFFLAFTNAYAGKITLQTTVTEVMAYAKDTAYSADECVVYVSNQFSSVCPSSSARFVIKQDTSVGKMMCSIALSAFMSGNTIKISSDNDTCSPNQGSPYARFVSVIK